MNRMSLLALAFVGLGLTLAAHGNEVCEWDPSTTTLTCPPEGQTPEEFCDQNPSHVFCDGTLYGPGGSSGGGGGGGSSSQCPSGYVPVGNQCKLPQEGPPSCSCGSPAVVYDSRYVGNQRWSCSPPEPQCSRLNTIGQSIEQYVIPAACVAAVSGIGGLTCSALGGGAAAAFTCSGAAGLIAEISSVCPELGG